MSLTIFFTTVFIFLLVLHYLPSSKGKPTDSPGLFLARLEPRSKLKSPDELFVVETPGHSKLDTPIEVAAG